MKFLITMLIFLCLPAFAKSVTYGKRDVRIPIRYVSEEGANTILRFPLPVARIENASMFVVKATNGGRSAPDYRQLELRPRVSSGSQTVSVLLNDGSLVRLNLEITSKAGIPTYYDLEPEKVASREEHHQEGAVASELDIFRSVLEGVTPSGMSRSSPNLNINCRAKGLSANLFRLFQGGGYKVFQIEIKNTLSKSTYIFHEEAVDLGNVNENKSPLIHISTRKIGPKSKSSGASVLTILADDGVRASSIKACNVSEQVELLIGQPKKDR